MLSAGDFQTPCLEAKMGIPDTPGKVSNNKLACLLSLPNITLTNGSSPPPPLTSKCFYTTEEQLLHETEILEGIVIMWGWSSL